MSGYFKALAVAQGPGHRQWLVAVKNEVAEFLAVFAIDLPAILERLGTFFAEQVWPIFVDVLTAPLLWLAVAALVFGSRVLSLAEVWRKGQPYAARVPGASTFARYADKRALRRIGPPPKGVRLAASQVKEAFFGDMDDKYLPTFHSLRLVLRAGLVPRLVRPGLFDDAIAQNYAGTC